MSSSRNEETYDSVALEQRPESPPGDWEFGNSLTPSEREKYRQEDRKKLETDRLRSRPEEQFHDEVEEEKTWLNDIIGKRDGNLLLARKTVVKRWIDQGIWRNEFQFSGPSKWKHEDPVSAEPECDTEGDSNAFSLSREETKSAETETLKGTGTEEQKEREREASRPFYRFMHQILVEREKLLETFAAPPDFKISPKDPSEDAEEGLNAYYQALGPEINKKQSNPPPYVACMVSDLLRYKWEKRGIWDDAWGRGIPDMSWKHERPLDDLFREAYLDESTKSEPLKGADSTPSTFGSVSYDDTDPGLRV